MLGLCERIRMCEMSTKTQRPRKPCSHIVSVRNVTQELPRTMLESRILVRNFQYKNFEVLHWFSHFIKCAQKVFQGVGYHQTPDRLAIQARMGKL